jgi:phosphopantetheinyl transferase
VRKEAFLKADGRGIAKALERVQIMQTKEGLNDESGLLDHSDAKTRCVVWDLIPAPDYVAALAFHSPHTTTSSSRVSEDRC